MTEVYMPEQRNSFSKFLGMFMQGANILQNGAKGFEAGKGMWDKFGATGGGSTGGGGGGMGGVAAGGAAAKYGLGVKFGNVTAEGASAAPAAEGGAMDTVGAYAPYAAPAVAAYGTYRDMKETGGANSGPIGTSPRSKQQSYQTADTFMKAGRDINAEANRFGKNIGLGLVENQPDRMDAIERRYSSQKNAMNDIEEARKALDVAGLPPEDRRSIAQKLERARQQIGVKNNGGNGNKYT